MADATSDPPAAVVDAVAKADGASGPNPNEAASESAAKSDGYGQEPPPPVSPSLACPEDAEDRSPSSASSPSSRRSMVTFNTGNNTVNCYTPSESSEEWDPHDDSDEPYEDAPEEISGHLWKKSPSSMLFSRYQQRYFRVKNARIHWWSSFEEFEMGLDCCRGMLDFKANDAELAAKNDAKFIIQPETGHWTSGNFTGYRAGRKFTLDTTNSEHSLSEWTRVIQAHLEFAKQHPIF